MHRVSKPPRQRLTRSEQRALTRERVLDAADAVFTEHGFHAARLEAVAELAGYTRGAVYSNFKNKNDLAVAILERRVGEVRRVLDELSAADGDSQERAHAAGKRFSDLFNAERAWGPLFFELVSHSSRDPELGRRMTELYRGLADSIAKVLRTMGASDGPGEAAPDRLALIMLAASYGADLQRMIDPERADAQLAGELLGLIAAGVQAQTRDALSSREQ
jgi:AcrR family transcriptional regulator